MSQATLALTVVDTVVVNSRLILVDSGQFVHAVGGDTVKNDSVESFHKTGSKWKLRRYRMKIRRSFSTFISNVQTDFNQCSPMYY